MAVTFVSSYGRVGGAQIYLERLLAALDESSVHDVISSVMDRSTTGSFAMATTCRSCPRREVVQSPRRCVAASSSPTSHDDL